MLDELERRFAHRPVTALRIANGGLDVAPVLAVDLRLVITDVAPIYRKRGNHFAQGVAEILKSEVARPAVLLGDAIEFARQHVQFARHGNLENQPLTLMNQIFVIAAPACEAGVKLFKRPLTGPIDENAV